MKTGCCRLFSCYFLLFFILAAGLISPLEDASASKPNAIGLDFPALLDESIKVKGALEDGLLIVAGKNNWDTLPENHEEMVRCVDKDSAWAASHAGFSTINKIWQYENPLGENENYTLRYSGYFYVDEDKKGTWQFCTYSHDASEIVIDGQVVTTWYGEHDAAGYYGEHSGSIELDTGWHFIVYRYAKGTGKSYSRADFKYPGARGWEEVSTEHLTIKHYPYEEGVLLVTKKNMADSHPDDHDFLKNYVDSSSEAHVDYFGWSVVDAIDHSENIHGEDTHYTSCYETFFEVTDQTTGNWQFAVDSGSASEIEIDETVVASWYGNHGAAPDDYSHNGSVTLSKGWHKLVFRQETLSDSGKALAFFKKPSDSDWQTVSKAHLTLKTYAADLDLDGIHNDIEAILGTDMENRDSDFESLNDYAEISLGCDPLKADTNNDGMPDTGEVLDKDRDPDKDGTDNLWDDDNDGDGVKDGIDTSPFAKTETKEEFHFEVDTGGNSTYLDFQLRTANPMNMMLFGKQYDWPYDTKGQMQDRDNTTDDVQLIPMLELTANLLPNQDHVEENGINVTTDGKVRAFDGNFTHNDGMGVGNVCGNSEKEMVTAGDKGHQIVVRTSTGEKIRSFDSVFSTGDKLVVADLLNNSLDEIVVLHDADRSVYIYSGEGHLIRKSNEDFSKDVGLAVGDVYGDEKKELVFGYHNSGHIHVITFFKSGSNRYAIDEDGLYSGNDGLGLSDVDGDGKCELLVAKADDDRLHIHEFYQTDGWNWSNSRKLTEFDFDFDPHDGLMGADVLVSDDPSHPRYGEEILLVKPDGHIRVYTEAGPNEEDRIDDTGYTEFDGYTAADIVGDDKKEIVITSDTTGVVNIYNTIDQKAYVPLAPVKENGITVAFQGRMIYTATGKPVKLTADARLVWFVVGKTDSEDDPEANETTVLAKYREEFYLTGFSATEYRGVRAGIVHKDDRDAVSNAYMLMHYNFLYGSDTLVSLPDTFANKGVTVDTLTQDFEHEYTAEKWINETLKDSVLKNLPDGKFPVAFGMDTRYAASDLAAFANESAVATGDRFAMDLESKKDAVSRTIKMNWYDTTLDSISPMGISDIHASFKEWGYTDKKIDIAIANIAIASAGEESAADFYSPLKRDGVGILYKSGIFAGNAYMMSISGNHLYQATKMKFKSGKVLTTVASKIKWMKAYKMAKEGGMFAKFGKYAGKVTKLAKIGGALTAVAFAAYTFYSVASSSGWSSAGILAGAMYAGMQGVYFMALGMISTAVPGGPVIAGLIIISDIITWAITGSGWSDKLMTWIARKLTEVTKPPKLDMDFGAPSVMIVDYDENGFDVGDRVEFKCRTTETIEKKSSTRTSDMKSSYIKPYAQFYDSTHYKDGSYRYEISNSVNSSRRIRTWDIGAWVEPKKADLDFTAKIKLSAKMKVYYRVCTGDECDRKSKTKNYKYDDTELVFDVMPGSLEKFINWPVLNPLDKDNDGIGNDLEDKDATWRAVINKKKSEDAENDIRLKRDGTTLLSTEDKGQSSQFRFDIANDKGQFRIMSRISEAQKYLRADNTGVMMSEAEDEAGLWDVIPVVDDLYRLVNIKMSEDNNTTWCLAMPEDDSDGTVQIKQASDVPNESLWSIQVEAANTRSTLTDTDNDGLTDLFETNMLNRGSILNGADKDMDNDGLTDKEELRFGTSPLIADSDNDGISDKDETAGWTVRLSYNTLTLSKKVQSNPADTDSDGDGLTDDQEKNARPPLNPYSKDTDGDGIPDNKDDDPFNSPDGPDSDFDRLSDQVETDGWQITITTEADGTITKTVTSNIHAEDSDGDTLPDREEYRISDPQSDDTDGDGIKDADEKVRGTDILHFDTDRDGLSDGAEVITHNTDPIVADTDKDGLSDGDEINFHNTDPLKTDTDDDGLSDFHEINISHTAPENPDHDGDGLSDGSEVDAFHTDPKDNDSDDDGLPDGAELNIHKTNPLSSDTDGDALPDADEVNTLCSSATKWDTDRDGLSDYDEVFVHGTRPCDSDHDNDNLNDGREVALGCDPKNKDSDGDLIEDGDEVNKYGTDPLSNDTDNDGLTDSLEIGVGGPNGLGTNPTEADTDNDGIIDSMDPDSTTGTIERIIVLYDAITDTDEFNTFVESLEELNITVDTGTPDDFPGMDCPYIVMLGEPDENAPEGSVANMIWQMTDEETRTGMTDDPYLRFGMSAVHKYTGLPENPQGVPPSGTTPDQTGPQVDLGLKNSLVVMLNGIHQNDASRTLSKFIQMKKLYWDNFVMQVFTTTNPYTNPVRDFQIDAIEKAGAEIDVTLSGDAAYAAGAVVAFSDITADHLLRSDNGLDQGETDVDGDEDVLVDQYILTEASAYIPDTETLPYNKLDPVPNPVSSATLTIYYSALSLDRSLPRDGDIIDMFDIDENTLSVYQHNGTDWDRLSADLDWVTSVSVNTANQTIDDKEYEGSVQIITTRPGLVCLAGKRRPDTTGGGAPHVIDVFPAPDADGILLFSDITMTFNEDVTIADSSGISVAGTTVESAVLSADNRTLTLTTPARIPGVTYTVILPENAVEDLAGNPNETEHSWSFTSIAPRNIPFANDDTLNTFENTDITGVNVMDDHGDGADSDDENATLTITKVNGDQALVGQNVSGSCGGIFTLAADGTLIFSPNGEFNHLGKDEILMTQIAYTLGNGTQTDLATVTVTVKGVNDRPQMTADERRFPDISEDAGDDDWDGTDGDDDDFLPINNIGTAVNDLLFQAGSITDTDSGILGMAMVSADQTNGVWQYSENGSLWTDATASISETNALLLDPDHLLRFVPNKDFFGVDAGRIEFKAWDMSEGTSGMTDFDTTISTACSTTQAGAVISINPVNDPPVITSGDSASIAENTPVTTVVYDAAATDVDNGQILTFSITGADADFFTIDEISGEVRFNQSPDHEAKEICRITLVVTDNGEGALTDSKDITITVTDVNERPSLSGGPVVLPPTDEDTVSTGMLVSDILAGVSATDDDNDPLGIAVTEFTCKGAFQFSSNSTDGIDGIWAGFSRGEVLTNTNALLLGPDTYIRYSPDTENGETPEITFRAWDQSAGSASDSTADSAYGNVQQGVSFSSGLADASTAVSDIDDAPVVAATAENPLFREGGDSAVLFSSAAVDTVDNNQTVRELVLTVTGISDGSGEMIIADTTPITLTNGNTGTTGPQQFTWLVSLSGTTATVTLTKEDTPVNYQTLVNSLAYQNALSPFDGSERAVSISGLTDSGRDTGKHRNKAENLSITSTVNGDTDGDGMADKWEDLNGLNKDDPADKEIDNDGDGLSNHDEYVNNTNPNLADTDGDGYLDGVEVALGTNPDNQESKPSPASEIWVDDNWNGAFSGQSVGGHTYGYDAFADLQVAMDQADANRTIHVAEGRYVGNFVWNKNLSVVGAGAMKTILDGDDNGPVIETENLTDVSELSGVTITNGQSDSGAGIRAISSGLIISGCIITGNNGPAFVFDDSNATLTNLTIAKNTNPYDPGMVRSIDSSPVITNCIFWDNGDGDIFANQGTSDPDVTYCIVQGGYPGAGNRNEHPRFLNAGIGDFHLRTGSPAIDNGENNARGIPATDIDAEPGTVNDTIDIGADEYLDDDDNGISDYQDDNPDIYVNKAPLLSDIGDRTVNEGETIQFIVAAADSDGDDLAFSADDLPADAVFNADTLTFSWMPGFDDSGDYTITINVTDNGAPQLSDSETITITVNNTNQPPVLSEIGNKVINENQYLSFTISGSDPDGDTIIFSAESLPDGAVFNTENRTFAWTPGYGATGSYDIIFTVTDNGQPEQSDSEKITISVGDVNRPPVLSEISSKTVNEGEQLAFSVTASDPDNDELTFYADGLPDGSDFNPDTRVFIWTPGFQDTGNHTVVFRVTDDGNPEMSDEQTVTISVTDVNRPPVLSQIGNKTVNEDETLSFTISGSDPDHDSLSFTATPLPKGALFDIGTRTFTWTPGFDATGSFEVIFRVTDDGEPALSDTETVTISVGDVNRPPVLSQIGNKTVNESQQLTLILFATDPDGDDLTYDSNSRWPDFPFINWAYLKVYRKQTQIKNDYFNKKQRSPLDF